MKDKRAVSCSACASINLELKRKLEKLFTFCVCASKTWEWGRRPGCPVESAVKVCVLVSADRLEVLQAVPDVRGLRSDQNEATSPPPLLRQRKGRREGRRGSEGGEGWGGGEVRKEGEKIRNRQSVRERRENKDRKCEKGKGEGGGNLQKNKKLTKNGTETEPG